MTVSRFHYKPTDEQKAELVAASQRIREAHARRRVNSAAADRVFALWPEPKTPMDNPFINSNFSDP
jgi:hypothetical protein